MGKVAFMKHKAVRIKSRLDELTLGMFNVRTAAVNGVSGIGHIDTMQEVVTLSDCRRPNGTELPKSSHLDTASISMVVAAGSKRRKGNVGLDCR